MSFKLTLPIPSEAAQWALFAPYCGGLSRQADLQRALRLLAQKSLKGERPLQGGRVHRFTLRWQGARPPLELCSCQLCFPDIQALTYTFDVSTHQLVDWLMDWPEFGGQGDLPNRFWKWLLLGSEESVGDA